MFNFDYVDPTDMSQGTKLVPGTARFKVMHASSHDAQGNPLLTKEGFRKMVVNIEATDCRGNVGHVRDNISQNAAWKLKQLVDGIGKIHLYTKSGQINPVDLVGGSGVCVLKLVGDYINVDKYTPKTDPVFTSDEVPF